MRELCDIIPIAWGDSKYYKEVRESYARQLLTPEQLEARMNPKRFDCSVKERADAAADLFKQFLGQKKRLDNLNVK